MSINHNDIRSIGEIQRTYLYNFKILKFPKVGKFKMNANDLNKRCKSSDYPKSRIENLTADISGFQTTQSGRIVFDNTMNVEFIDTEDNKVKDFIKEWRSICSDFLTGKSYDKKDVEILLNLELLTHNLIVNRVFTFTGCIYSTSTNSKIDGESNSFMDSTIEFNYDYFDEK